MAEVKTVLTADVSGFTSDMIKAEKSTVQFGNSMTKAGSNATTLKGALRQATKEAMDLSLQMSKMSQTELDSDIGRELQAQFQQALQAAGNFKDQMEDVNREIKNIASDTAGWDAAKEGIGVLSSSMQGLAGVVGLCGGDVTAFTKALTVMNTIQQVTNSIIAIGNALQKQSALMTNLRAVGTRLLAKATTEATTAQLANNAAVLSNPYVLAAAAIAALCAGIYAWVNANNDLTDSEKEKGEAMAAVAEQMDKQADKLATQISAFKILQTEYEKNGHSLNEMKKNMTNFDDVCKNANITLKDQATAEKVLGSLAPVMIAKYRAEAKAAAGAAAMQAEYGRIMAKVADIQKRLAEGKTIDAGDLQALNIDPKKLKQLGLEWEHGLDDAIAEVFQPSARDIKMAAGKGADEVADALTAAAYDAFENGGKFDYYTKQIEDGYAEMASAVKTFQEHGVDTGTLFGNAEKQIKKTSKTSKEAVRETLNSLEGCDAIIQHAEKDMKKLDKTTGDYANKVAALKQTIITARVAKLNLLDKSTPAGLLEARRLIEQIMQELPEGSKTLEEMRGELQKVDEKLFDMLNSLAKHGGTKELKEALSQVDKIIASAKVGSDEWKKWIGTWREINGVVKAAEEETERWKEGIEKGSKVWIEMEIAKKEGQIKDIEKQANPNLQLKYTLELEIDDLKAQLGEINQLLRGIEVTAPAQKWWEAMDIDFRDFDNAVKRFENLINNVKEYLAYANQFKREDVGAEKWEELQEGIGLADRQLSQFGKDLVFEKITQQIKEMNAELLKVSYDSFKSGIDSLHTMYNVIDDLPDRLDECKNGFEGFFEIMSAGFSIIDSIVSFIENIQKVIELVKGLTAAKGALALMTEMETAATAGETTELAANTGQTLANTAASTANAGAAIGEAGANTANAATKAASQLASTGPWGWIAGIAAAAAIAAALFAIIGSAKGYAEGGIVQGSTTVGDRVYARLNAGEMVLNRGQQARLFRLINGGAIGTNNNELTGTVRVKGSDLYMSLNNYNKITGKKV